MNSDEIHIPFLPKVKLSEKSNLPTISAVYFALSYVMDVLYIGTAYNLCTRWKRHHKLHDLQVRRCEYIAWHKSTIKDLYAIERELIVTYRPPLNTQQLTFQVPITINGAKLKEIRCNLGMSQKELAAKTGLRNVYIAKIEEGLTRGYHLNALHLLCRTLDVQPAYLLDI